MKKKYIGAYALIVLSLLTGSLFYIFPGFRTSLFAPMIIWNAQSLGIIEFISHSLSDGLWMVALGTSILLIWDLNWSIHTAIYYLSAIVLALLFEVMQSVNLIPGTFDWNDMTAIAMGSIIPIFLLSKKQNHESDI